MTMVRVRSCIFSLFVVVLLLLVGDALSQDLSCFAIGCPDPPEDDYDDDYGDYEPEPEPTPSSPGDIPEISPGLDDPSPSPSPSPFPSPSPVGGGGGGVFFGGGGGGGDAGGGGGGRRPRRDRYSYRDNAASSSSNTAAASIPQRPTSSTGGQVITASGWTENESGGNAENESEEYTDSSYEPEEGATASANEDAIQFTLPDGQVVETTLVGLVYEKGFQAGYKAEYMEGHNDASTGADPRGPLEIDFCECDTVAEEAQDIAELDELFLPDGDSTFSVANSLQASEEDVDAAVRTSFGKGVEEGLKADHTAYVQGYADGGAGVAPQNPPFHGETFTYLS